MNRYAIGLREWRFRYFKPQKALWWITSEPPSPVMPPDHIVEFKVLDVDYRAARIRADKMWEQWLEEHKHEYES